MIKKLQLQRGKDNILNSDVAGVASLMHSNFPVVVILNLKKLQIHIFNTFHVFDALHSITIKKIGKNKCLHLSVSEIVGYF